MDAYRPTAMVATQRQFEPFPKVTLTKDGAGGNLSRQPPRKIDPHLVKVLHYATE